jgi:hypothetical protein
MRSRPLVAALAAAAIAAGAAPAAHAASWQFAPAQAPPTPAGAQPAPFGVPLGPVSDIEFWAPNRGLLMTRGNNLVPMGLYAYDGTAWHQLSTVCGGSDGRIAWAGPDEFWTIADQRPGQVTAGNESLADLSLCHFAGGQVVASYAMPLDQPDSYLPMDAAACDGPSDCWFGGARRGFGGAFHLHWDGTSLSVLISPQDHAIADMTWDGSELVESVDLGPSDSYDATGESPASPPLLHALVAGAGNPFQSLFPSDPRPLPSYGTDDASAPVLPSTLAALALGSDAGQAGSGAAPAHPQLWAVAGPRPFATAPPGTAVAHPIVLREIAGIWTQVVPDLGMLAAGDDPVAVAPEPGLPSAWVAADAGDGIARVDHLGAGGGPGPIACPAVDDCWAATDEGWLFHYTDGTALPHDGDAAFAGVIAFRPSDAGVPVVPPDSPPPDDSLLNQPPPVQPPAKKPRKHKAKRKPAAKAEHVKLRLVHGTTLQLTFTLTARAHVQLVAERQGEAVARTSRRAYKRGRHTLSLRLDAHRWPTKLDLRVRAY